MVSVSFHFLIVIVYVAVTNPSSQKLLYFLVKMPCIVRFFIRWFYDWYLLLYVNVLLHNSSCLSITITHANCSQGTNKIERGSKYENKTWLIRMFPENKPNWLRKLGSNIYKIKPNRCEYILLFRSYTVELFFDLCIPCHIT